MTDHPDWSKPPKKPICWNADRTGPCEYAKGPHACIERRQRILAGVVRSADGSEVVVEDLAVRGYGCLWYQGHKEREAREARRAMQKPEAA